MRCAICRRTKGGTQQRPGTIEITAGGVELHGSWLCVGCLREGNAKLARAHGLRPLVKASERPEKAPDDSGHFRIDGAPSAEEELKPA